MASADFGEVTIILWFEERDVDCVAYKVNNDNDLFMSKIILITKQTKYNKLMAGV